MRCNICNAVLSQPNYSSDHESYDPCDPCLLVVKDTLEGYLDTPSADEEALGGPDPFLTSLTTLKTGLEWWEYPDEE